MSARQYVENDLLDKSPVELIRLLYSKAIEKLHLAGQHTQANDLRERSLCLARAMEIVAELQGALNMEAGGDLAVELARLYDYVQRQLIDAAAQPASVVQIEEARTLLVNLCEGWQECEPPAAQRPQPREAALSEGPGAGEAADQGEEMEQQATGSDELEVEEIQSPLAPASYDAAGGERVWTL